MSRDDEHGLPVHSRSNAELERIAEHVAEAAGIDISAANILDVIADFASRFKATFGLEIIEVPDDELPNREAEAQLIPPVIRVRKSVLAAAHRNDRRARMTFAHEFAHLILEHGGEARGRSIETTAPVRAHEDAEHQAKFLAACLLMRVKQVQSVGSAKELAMLCGVSVQAAELRFEDVFKRSKGRPTPPLVKQFLEARRPKQIQDAAKVRSDRVARELDEAWSRLEAIDGEPPHYFRKARGYKVCRDHYLKPRSHMGWRLYQGEIRAYQDLESQ